jgi:hypothetical protein
MLQFAAVVLIVLKQSGFDLLGAVLVPAVPPDYAIAFCLQRFSNSHSAQCRFNTRSGGAWPESSAAIFAIIHPSVDAILERATNVLSIIHPHIWARRADCGPSRHRPGTGRFRPKAGDHSKLAAHRGPDRRTIRRNVSFQLGRRFAISSYYRRRLLWRDWLPSVQDWFYVR